MQFYIQLVSASVLKFSCTSNEHKRR